MRKNPARLNEPGHYEIIVVGLKPIEQDQLLKSDSFLGVGQAIASLRPVFLAYDSLRSRRL